MHSTMKKYIVFTFIMVFAFAKAQKTSPTAEKKYDKFAFIDSRKVYERMAEKGYKSIEIFSKLGDTYYFNNDYENALKWYDQLFELEKSEIPSKYYFRYAQALKSGQQYAKAEGVLKAFYGNGITAGAFDDLSGTPKYLDLVEFQKGRFEVQPVEINTTFQDFGTAYYGPDKVVFASARDTGLFFRRRHSWNEQAFLDLYVADRDSTGALGNVEKFDKRVNSILHEATPTFTKDLNTVYFTRNYFEKGNIKRDEQRVNRLQIFKSERVNGKWSKPQVVDFSEGNYSTAHPALTPDGKTLYFSSDMPGTMGADGLLSETDIWRIDIEEDGSYSNLENVALVNTNGRETYPFVSDNGDLYFASNGLPGLGGLDIFVATMNEDGSLNPPVNIGAPANSVNDDFAFIIEDGTSTGYFSSNRDNGGDNDDIYRFVQTEELREVCKQTVTGVVTDAVTGEILPDARVNVIGMDNVSIAYRSTNSNGKYAFELECGQSFFIRAEKPQYNTAEELINTPETAGVINVNLALDPINQKGGVGDDLAKLLQLNPIYFDFDMSFIRQDAELELQKVLAVMEDNPTMVIDIRSHTDSRGDDSYNMRLSERRAASTKNYLIAKGIDASRLTSKGYGESQLVNDCANGVPCTEAQHQNNRRSEFIITSM